MSARLSAAAPSAGDVADFERLLADARRTGGESPAPGLRETDSIAMLGHLRGVAYGRWIGGPADTLSIGFNLQHAGNELRGDRSFTTMLERAGKVWSHRIADTWSEWERRAGESKGRLIGNYGISGRDIRVGPGRETSTGLLIHVTGGTLSGNGIGGPRSLRPGDAWEPHTGAVAFDTGHVEEAEEASLFRTMVHEIGHVLGAWQGDESMKRYAPYTDRVSGTWLGPHVVAAHGGAAPFQDGDDGYGWHDGERSPDAVSYDFAHSGVCASVMAYCADGAAIPAFLPAEIDFAFLRDLGLTVTREPDRPETYGLAGWMDHSAFTVSVSRELEVSLSEAQPRYFSHGGRWQDLDMVDLLWAEADAFGSPSSGGPQRTFPLGGTVSYAGGLIGTAVDHSGLPPVYGDANLSVDLGSLSGKASFTSLQMSYDGQRYIFGDGDLHYALTLEDNELRHVAPGVSLTAGFYGPRHDEVAGTLDDSRAGLLASFGAGHDERPARRDVIAGADHIRGLRYQDGWYRYRCGSGPGCERKFEWWKRGNDWYDVGAAESRSPRELVLGWTAGWGDWMSEDLFADYGEIRVSRRYASATDGRKGRYQQDGYFGVMNHAAFGTGFYRYSDWERRDGDLSDFSIRGTGFQGDVSGSRPQGSATWEGRMVGYQAGLKAGEDPFVQGAARVRLSFRSESVDIGFSGIRSMDRKRSLDDFSFEDIRLAADGTFDGFDGGHVEGAFFGPAHEEAAGMFHKNANKVTGSFGAVGRQ